jgi:hypothetical protein
MPDSILEGDHPRIISEKFGWIWLSSFRGEHFFLNFIPLFSIFSLAAILVESRDHRIQLWKGAMQRPFHQSLVAMVHWFLRRIYLCEFPIGSYVKLISTLGPSWSKGRTAGHIFGREPSKTISSKFNSYWANGFRQEHFDWNFPYGPMLN